MSNSLGTPKPDCLSRRSRSGERRDALSDLANRRGAGVTSPNGEETQFTGFDLNYHKGLPHDVNGMVHRASYHAMVAALTMNSPGGLECLPIGANRLAATAVPPPPSSTTPAPFDALNPPQFTTVAGSSEDDLPNYRKLTSPLTGHVYDTQGADAGALAISSVPSVSSDEFAAEVAELYVMALLRDEKFTDIGAEAGASAAMVAALGTMPFFQAGFAGGDGASRRRYQTRGTIANGGDLFRGSTPGSKIGHWMSQFLLIGSDTTSKDVEGNSPNNNPAFRGVNTDVRHNHGFVYMGTQIIDQRNAVAKEGVDYLTTWASWLDAQNGVDFNNLDTFGRRRRYLTTPRDIATYVHFDALYQAYHVASLIMLHPTNPGRAFPFERGLPETSSWTRAAFASFGGPHILSLVTEVATRALKAVWRQKWMHHRRMRPEVAAALITLHANDASRIQDKDLRMAIGNLAAKIPSAILGAIDAHNQAQNTNSNNGKITDVGNLVADFGLPDISAKNYLLPMAFPEGSPTHPAYGAGHATVAGACVTVLKAFFEMFNPDGSERVWPLQLFVPDLQPGTGSAGNEDEGGELVPLADADIYVPASISSNPTPAQRRTLVTVQGELDKLAMNVANARNMAGVHFYTDYYESVRLGERVAVSIIEEHLSLYDEPVSMSFTSFDGEQIRIASNGDTPQVNVDGTSSEGWYGRYGS